MAHGRGELFIELLIDAATDEIGPQHGPGVEVAVPASSSGIIDIVDEDNVCWNARGCVYQITKVYSIFPCRQGLLIRPVAHVVRKCEEAGAGRPTVRLELSQLVVGLALRR